MIEREPPSQRAFLTGILSLLIGISYGFILNMTSGGIFWTVHEFLFPFGLMVILVIAALIPAALGRGPTDSGMVAFGFPVGQISVVGVAVVGESPTQLELIGVAIAFGLVFAVTIGLIGYLLGSGIRHVTHQSSTESTPERS